MSAGWRGLVIPAALLALWVAVTRGSADSATLPPPEAVVRALGSGLQDGSLPHALGVSLLRYLSGLALGTALGLGIGIAIGMSRLSARLVLPSLDAFKLVSPFAWIPLIMAWLGLGEASKLAFIALVTFLPIAFATIEGLATTPRSLVELARVQRLGPVLTLLLIALPSAAPAMFGGFYLALVAAWMATLGSEYMLTSGGGIGAALVAARDAFAMPALIVDIALVGLIGFLFHRGAQAVEARALHWRRTLGTETI